MLRIVYALVVKDLKGILRNRQVWLPMLLLPVIMTIFMPASLVVTIERGIQKFHGLQHLMVFLPAELRFATNVQQLFYVMINFMFPPLFMMIPLMAGTVIGASCIVGEKEGHTLETLLYTPVTIEQLLAGKLFAAFVPSYLVSLISFVAFCLTVNLVGADYLAGQVFPNTRWLVLILFLAPPVILFGLTVVVIISAYANTFEGAQQMSGFIVLPFMMILIGQTSGLVVLQTSSLITMSPLLLLLDFLLLRLVACRMTCERLLQ